ncbi:MAG: diguanylate cyclase, partial [Cyanobacteria bacterium NC_groundwater_1444_Ag_S-0.65um_54_12]|nr:diguanylate cyclase [Cyanobacteria bacterium NC_groundwater_1444_Ag_S-0.65um_54_12]
RLIRSLANLGELTADIAAAPNLRLALRPILLQLLRELGIEQGAIYERKASGARRLELLAAVGVADSGSILILPENIEQQWLRGEAPLFTVGDRPRRQLEQLIAKNSSLNGPTAWQVGIPLAVRGMVYGLVLLGSKRDRFPYTPLELNVLSIMSQQLAVAWHCRSQQTERAFARNELHQFQQIAQKIHSTLKPAVLNRLLLCEAVSLTAARCGLLFTYDEIDHELQLAESFNYPCEEWPVEQCLSVTGSWLELVVTGKAGQIFEAGGRPPGSAMQCLSSMAVPILVRRASPRTSLMPDELTVAEMPVAGVLCLFDKEERFGIGSFGADDLEALTALAATGGVAMENARLYEQATVDSLTRLFIRRFFEQKLTDELLRNQRNNTSLALLLLDIDHFKAFNDTYGHQLGDQVLRQVSQILARSVRDDIDIPARYGGEELVALLPETELSEAKLVAERIREAIAQQAIPGPKGAFLQVTVSIGVATYPDHACDGASLIAAADNALYKSKRSGRNCVSVCQQFLS